MDFLLHIEGLSASYGAIAALRNIHLEVSAKKLVVVVGANGAGKSTLLNTISGLVHPSRGKIRFLTEDLTRVPPHKIVEKGIIQVPEGRRIFPSLTVFENLVLGTYRRGGKYLKQNMESVIRLFPLLKERKNQLGGSLSGGEQQMLAIARSLMGQPQLLLMDEPSLGLAPLIIQEIFKLIVRLKEEGITILLVEQNARQALSICDDGYVLRTGEVALRGTGCEILNNEELFKQYLLG